MTEFIKYSKKMEIFMSLILLMSVTLIACNMNKVVENRESTVKTKEKDYIVVIDPGHGGEDPGKVGINNAKEKEVNLAIALQLRDILQKKGINVVMTRDTDTSLKENGRFSKIGDLNGRCNIINKTYDNNNKCVLISVHQNSFTGQSVHGAQVFYYQKSPQSMKLAKIMQEKFNKDINTEKAKNEKPNDSYYMLINSKCPGIIVECGFLSNPEEADKLINSDYQKQLGDILCRGIMDYFSEMTETK